MVEVTPACRFHGCRSQAAGPMAAGPRLQVPRSRGGLSISQAEEEAEEEEEEEGKLVSPVFSACLICAVVVLKGCLLPSSHVHHPPNPHG